jgi:aspartate/methionine/tyrosine aminotransferase
MVMEKESPEEIGYGNIKYNLTESSVPDQKIENLGIDLGNLILCYGDHSGKPDLRDLLANHYDGLSPENIMTATGACMALFIVNATILNPGDHIVVAYPNYASNIEVPRSLGCNVDLLELKFENNFQIDLDELKSKITPKTKLVSITYPHNPTGTMISEQSLNEIIKIIEKNNCYLLMDETYRELTLGEKLPTAASLCEKAISVESMSKAYGIPGIRLGWLATKSKDLKEAFLAAKEQIGICTSVIDEEIAYIVLKRKEEFLSEIRKQNQIKLDIVKKWMNKQTDLEWIEPKGGVVCFPRMKADVNAEKFYRLLNEKYETFVGPGHWFDMSDIYFRLGYGWPTEEELKAGIQNITKALAESKRYRESA